MNLHLVFLLSGFITLNYLHYASGYMVGENPHHRREVLDAQGKYQLEWIVDFTQKRVNFTVSVETKGWIGFGLSNSGKMTGSDIVIGGVGDNGRPYFRDYHALGHQTPDEDPSQDWTLVSARETRTHTIISFSRAFDTCDPQDYPITEDKISLIWAYSENDRPLQYHRRNRGEYPIYLIHPDHSPPTVNDPNVGSSLGHPNPPASTIPLYRNLKTWTLNTRQTIPARDTTYWCTMHKGPRLQTKHHIVGFEVRFPDPVSRSHVHHLLLHRCRAPRGRTSVRTFDPFLRSRGQLCYLVKIPLGPMPTEYCTDFIHVWTVGGRPYFFPPHAGTPIGEEEEEYYLLQTHYDNPQEIQNLDVDMNIDFYYTPDLRANDAGLHVVRHESPGAPPSLLIAPSTIGHQAYGFCGSECSREILPPEGIRIFGMLLHSHNAGSGMRSQQFRGNRELPWIQSDDNYSFAYQQNRNFNKEVKVMPGDMLVAKCTYDNTRANGTVTSGFSSQQEMCAAWFYYYNKMEKFMQCSSEIVSDWALEEFLSVDNVTWSNERVAFVVDPPDALAGLTVAEVSDDHVVWDAQKRADIQRFQLTEPHVSRCPQELYSMTAEEQVAMGPRRLMNTELSENAMDPRERTASYPYNARPWQPESTCSFRKG